MQNFLSLYKYKSIRQKSSGGASWKIAGFLFIGILLTLLWLYKPSHFYFFGDSWDILYQLLINWKAIFLPHNEYFIPLFNSFYFSEYKVFGGHHLPYVVVSFVLHSLNAMLVFLLGVRLSLGTLPSLIAAVIFAFSSVYWEVMGWSVAQVWQLGTLFMLLAILIFIRNRREAKTFFWVGVLSFATYVSAGFIAIVFPIIASVYYFLETTSENDPSKKTVFSTLLTQLMIWLPTLAYFSLLKLLGFAQHLGGNHAFLSVYNIPELVNFTLFGTVYGLVLPSLTFVNAPSFQSAPVLLVTGILFVTISYSKFSSTQQRRIFWFLILFLVAPMFVISLGRAQFGAGFGLSSRYQYVNSVPFALLVVYCWQALSNSFTSRRAQYGVKLLAFLLLAYYLSFHAKMIRHKNPGADRGQRARQFLNRARQASFPTPAPSGAIILGPELALPDSAYAPGYFPLWKAFQVLEGNTVHVVPVKDYLGSTGFFSSTNLVLNDGFYTGNGRWRPFGNTTVLQPAAVHNGSSLAAEVIIGPGATFAQNAIQSCPYPLPPTIFTFSIRAKTNQEGVLSARIIFQDQSEGILGESQSLPHPGDGFWHPLVISGFSPEGTCTVGVDVVNNGRLVLASGLSKPVLVAHPGTVDHAGKIVFQSLKQILKRKENK